MNFDAARMAMVESQIRPNGVRGTAILNAMATLPRELFVPEGERALAYRDGPVLAAEAAGGAPARYLLAPMTLSRMLQALAPSQADRALDVGGVTGYSAAILAQTCGKVLALEASESLANKTRECLKAAGVRGVEVYSGPLNEGLAKEQPFTLILVSGAAAQEPERLLGQLAVGGRLAVIIRKGWFGHAYLFTKSAGAVSGRPVFDAGAEILPGFEAVPQFAF
jgi:protein-L-isoaspartate(D-aspartate) O-methyltransferase